jgi:hypothetical protein
MSLDDFFDLGKLADLIPNDDLISPSPTVLPKRPLSARLGEDTLANDTIYAAIQSDDENEPEVNEPESVPVSAFIPTAPPVHTDAPAPVKRQRAESPNTSAGLGIALTAELRAAALELTPLIFQRHRSKERRRAEFLCFHYPRGIWSPENPKSGASEDTSLLWRFINQLKPAGESNPQLKTSSPLLSEFFAGLENWNRVMLQFIKAPKLRQEQHLPEVYAALERSTAAIEALVDDLLL